MSTPTRTQLKLLKAIHVQAVASARMLTQAKTRQAVTGESPPDAWYVAFRSHALLRQELANIATAAGIPAEWRELCEKRGELGWDWKSRLHWREPATAAKRSDLLAGLEAEVREFQNMAAVAAVYAERGEHAEVGTARMFDRSLRVTRQRLGGLGGVLALTSVEAERLWGHRSWQAAADSVRDVSADVLAARWRAYARASDNSQIVQARALSIAGFDPDSNGSSLPTLAEMRQQIRAHLADHTPEPISSAHTTQEVAHDYAFAVNAEHAIHLALPEDADIEWSAPPDIAHTPWPAAETTPGPEP